MQSKFSAPEIECEGCANSIKNALSRVPGISAVNVDVEAKTVAVTHEEPAGEARVIEALDRAGFPAQKVSV